MTDTVDVVNPVPEYKCHECNKTYAIKGSYSSHMRLKHRANKVSEDVENGSGGNPYRNKKKTSSAVRIWTENKVDEMPMMMTRELDSYIDNINDAAAAAESEKKLRLK